MTEEPGAYPNGHNPDDPYSFPLNPEVYIAAAFRFGWKNHEILILGAGTQEKMEELAHKYYRWRGAGKYSAGVFRNGDLGFDEPLAYYPSSWREERPRACSRGIAAEHMGHLIWTIAETGKDLHGQPVEVPPWIQERITEAELIAEAFRPLEEAETQEA